MKPTVAPFASLAGIFLVLTVPLVWMGVQGTNEAYDAASYHVPAIQTIARDGLDTDWRAVKSATTPGFHVFMAALYTLDHGRLWLLQAANLAISTCLVLLVFSVTRRFSPTAFAVCLTLPLLLSSYVLGSAIWLTTDNFALLPVVVVAASCLEGTTTWRASVQRAVFLTFAVLVRQIQLWLVVPAVVSAMLKPDWRGRGARTALEIVCPLVAVGVFVVLWRGFVPPEFQNSYERGLRPVGAVTTIAIFGWYATAFTPHLLWRAWERRQAARLAVGLFLASLCVPTSFDVNSGRWGGAIWAVVQVTPVVFGRSVVICIGAALAGLAAGALWHAAGARGRRDEAAFILTAVAACAIAQIASGLTFQRYVEPVVLISLIWLTALTSPAIIRRRHLVGVVCLAGLQIARDVFTLYVPALVSSR